MIGRILDEKYKIIDIVGSGGMATVYCAVNLSDYKLVSIKMLKPELYHDIQNREMLKKEASVALQLVHPNIIRAHDIVDNGKEIYIVLDYVEGKSLKEYIQEKKILTSKEVIKIGTQIGGALECAHKYGFVHKDVKPQNIIIDSKGDTHLTDFGIASNQEDMTKSKRIVFGSVYYFAPEQAKGLPITPQCDIYSLGVVLYELATGELPFMGKTTQEIALKHINETAVPANHMNPSIYKSLSTVIAKAMESDLSLRYKNISALVHDLKEATVHYSGNYVKYPDKPSEKKSKKSLIISVVVVTTVFLGLFILGFMLKDATTANLKIMPNLQNSTYSQATSILDRLGIHYDVHFQKSDDSQEDNIVIYQSVVENEVVENNQVVVLRVTIGKDNNTMPDFSDTRLTQALAYLDSTNMMQRSIQYVDSNLPYNFIVSQEPSAGSLLDPSAQLITLYVSNNSTDNTVPDLTNKSLQDAKQLALEQGYDIGIIYEVEKDKNVVYSQLPEPNQKTNQDAYINIWLGKENIRKINFYSSTSVTIPQDGTRVRVCFIDDDGFTYFVNDYTLNTGIHDIFFDFNSKTATPKTVVIYYDGVKQFTVDNILPAKNN